ncbi:aldose epimerase [Burkholderia glumae]|uniref:aldose epimerase n=1 Tax=Burkholderia glumae TaxID=337 RepID=UPI002150AE20|nr:aldose epimerase [Burkholderia glumae]UVS98086.1 aldose epimerase [Burkholderia glumae]
MTLYGSDTAGGRGASLAADPAGSRKAVAAEGATAAARSRPGRAAAAERRLSVANACLRLEAVAGARGGLTRFDWNDRGAWTPVFDGTPPAAADAGAPALASYPVCHVRGHSRPGTRSQRPRPAGPAGPALPGPATGATWQVERLAGAGLRLAMRNLAELPYALVQEFELDGPTLTVRIEFENAASTPVRVATGLCTSLVRDADTSMCAPASGLWLPSGSGAGRHHVPTPPAWQFGVSYPLPPARVEHLFTGWGGRAVFAWPARHYALEVAADARAYWLHASAQPARFCFHALGGPAEGAGLADRDDDAVWVDAGATLSRRFRFTVERTGTLTRTPR